MIFPNDLLPEVITWLLLATTVITAFIQPRYWLHLLVITFASALYFNNVNFVGILAITAGLAVAALAREAKGKWKVACHCLVIMWCLALVLHLIPGFNNLLVLDKVITGPESIPFTLYLNLDKPMAFFGLLLLVPTMLGKRNILSPKHISILAISFILLPVVPLVLNLVKPELSVPSWWWIFALNNLLFTCVAEEALFRGYIQRLLTQRFNPLVGIGIASLLFGAAHFAGGPLFIVVASLAGLLYGLTYYWSGKLSYAVAIHFGFNMVHLLFFTYPLANNV